MSLLILLDSFNITLEYSYINWKNVVVKLQNNFKLWLLGVMKHFQARYQCMVDMKGYVTDG